MRVRAKFKLDSYETSQQIQGYEKGPEGKADYSKPVIVEMRTLKMSPVTGNSDENKQFWGSTPAGQLTMGVLNQLAWKHFELGKEYYLDFVPAE
jgi:hypothetical protein